MKASFEGDILGAMSSASTTVSRKTMYFEILDCHAEK
jgi:hypothetical protein